MIVVVGDTSPLNYLIQIECQHLLPALFERILVPAAVVKELDHPGTPAVVRTFLRQMPQWIAVRQVCATPDPALVVLDHGEREAIQTEILCDVDRRSKTLTPAEKELAELLTLLIEGFEERRYQLPRAKPLDALRFLMHQHGLNQKDLADVFGAPSIVSEALSAKRELNKHHIKRLSERFRVSPELFF
jgi:HTH-type transcriptional regulator/antitoxin HigA